MSSLLIDPVTNDIASSGGKLIVAEDSITLTAQYVRNLLKSFTGTLFTNINYGVEERFLTEITDISELDQHIKGLILSVPGVLSIKTFSSSIDSGTGGYSCDFQAVTEENEVFEINLPLGVNNTLISEGVWYEGVMNPWGVLIEDEVIGSG